MEGRHLDEVLPGFISAAKQGRFYSEELIHRISSAHSIQGIQEIPSDVRELFLTAHDVPSEQQIDLQAVFQRHVDNAVSKTINLPSNASWKEVCSALTYAHSKGCKGLTVYREGSKPGQVLTTIKDTSSCPTCGRFIRAEEGALQCESCG
jgi:ribonucleoside-diphosphate reductase alpha chain